MSRVAVKIEDFLPYLKYIRSKKQEYVVCLSIDSGGRLIKRRTVTIGLLSSSMAHPREVYAGSIKDRAAMIIIAHNHPSGLAEPSEADIGMTQQLAAAGILLGVPLHDHLIVTADAYFSFRERQLL